MRYVQKLLAEPDFYLVYLPQKTKNIYFDVFIKTGRLHESDEQMGIGHLLDHYINGSIYAKYLDRLNTNAWISQEHLHFHLSTTQQSAEKDLTRFLKEVFQPSFDNEELFLFERQSIINEMKNESATVSSRQFQLVTEHRFEPGSSYRRATFAEADNVHTLNLTELRQHHRQHFHRQNVVIFVAAHQVPRKLLNNIFHQIKAVELPNGQQQTYPLQRYSGFKIVTAPEWDVAGQQYVSLSWPGLSYENAVKERISLNVFCRLLTGLSRHGLFKDLRQAGIYAIDYHNIYYCHFGLVALWATIPPSRLEQFLGLVSGAIKHLGDEPLSRYFLDSRLKGVRERTRNAWRNNNDLYNWVIEYILDEGEIRTPKEVFACLKEITPAYLQQLVKTVFDPAKLNVVISGETPTVSQKTLQSWLKF